MTGRLLLDRDSAPVYSRGNCPGAPLGSLMAFGLGAMPVPKGAPVRTVLLGRAEGVDETLTAANTRNRSIQGADEYRRYCVLAEFRRDDIGLSVARVAGLLGMSVDAVREYALVLVADGALEPVRGSKPVRYASAVKSMGRAARVHYRIGGSAFGIAFRDHSHMWRLAMVFRKRAVPLTMCDLARAFPNVPISTLRRTVSRLLDAGWLCRMAGDGDAV
jgi:DNA-binding transcriptional ArsR family regulator